MARKVVHDGSEEDPRLFDLPTPIKLEPKITPPTAPIWTENKAKLIERYLYYFVLLTKHGTYIDGFAGPQDQHHSDSWAAKLVLESTPRWFRNFYLYDKGKRAIAHLEALRQAQPERDRSRREPKRHIAIKRGDFNTLTLDLLTSGEIKQKEATFCLLDQRTFECHWATLKALAEYKTSGHKIELFYFLPIFWLDRAFAAQKEKKTLDRWWGRGDWSLLRDLSPLDRAHVFVRRMKKELGYGSVKPWAIYQRQDSTTIMYYMIHATDHPEAPKLMSRAYRRAVGPKETGEQFHLWAQSAGISESDT